MAGAILPKLVGCTSLYILRNTEQPKYRLRYIYCLGTAKRRLVLGGHLPIFTHLITFWWASISFARKNNRLVRDWIKHMCFALHFSPWSRKHPNESWGRGEQWEVAAINPSGNALNRIQDEHPINFVSLKSYLGNQLIGCGVTTMWLSYHFERKHLNALLVYLEKPVIATASRSWRTHFHAGSNW